MSNLEFISSITQTLAWPAFALAILFYYRSKLREFALEMLGAKTQVKLIEEGEAPKSNTVSPIIKRELTHYKLYSNSLPIQVIKLRVLPNIERLELVCPVAFPN